jgi:hypothetical protein
MTGSPSGEMPTTSATDTGPAVGFINKKSVYKGLERNLSYIIDITTEQKLRLPILVGSQVEGSREARTLGFGRRVGLLWGHASDTLNN